MSAPLDFTLSAGPVAASPRTLAALGEPITYHYDPDFLALFRRTQAKAAQVMQTTNDVLLMQGEAILGLEAGASALFTPGAHVLNLVQGVFGKGMGHWITGFGAILHEIEVPYNDAVDPSDVIAYLDANPQIEILTVVASETPSGTVCNIEAIGRACAERGVVTFVDVVSGVGGMPFNVDAWGLDVCVAGLQKCLGGPPGVSIVTVSPRAWERINANPDAPRDSYLSMLDWKIKWLENGAFPYTPSVSDMHGAESCLDQALEEGIDNMIQRHARAAEVARAGVLGLGLELWAKSDDVAAWCVTSVRLADNIDHVELRTLARARYGVMLSSGQGAGNLIRIGHMGPTARGMYPVVGVAAVGQAIRDLGGTVDLGAGHEQAMGVLARQMAL